MSVVVESPVCTVDLVSRPALVKGGRNVTVVTAVEGTQVFTASEPGRGRAGDEVTILPVTGECVAVPGDEPISGYWVGLVDGAVGAVDGRVEAFVLCGSHLRTVGFTLEQVDARRAVTNRAAEAERAALAALGTEAQEHRRDMVNHKWAMDRLVSEAHEWADANELCSRFDDFMQQQGLAPRCRDHDLVVEVTATVRLTREGRSAEDVIESLTDEDVFRAIDVSNIVWDAESDD